MSSRPGSAGPPLWRQLQVAAQAVQAVRQGASTTTALADIAGELRPGVQSLVFHALRQLGRAEALRARLAKRPPPPPADALLCTALALCWNEALAPYEPFTLVNQAVEAAKRQRATLPQAAFINACLRRFLRERQELLAATDADPVARWNHPAWWIRQLQKDHPEHWAAILEANNDSAPLVLRVNARKAGVPQVLKMFTEAGIAAHRIGEHAIRLDRARPVPQLPGFAEGLVSVQDAGAQLAAPLLLQHLDAPAPGQRWRILDACAAPGGKTAHLLELCEADLTALDVDPARCERIHQNLQRLDLQAGVLTADAAAPERWWDGQLFDAILLDAPCTASGIVRRHPDVRWLRRPGDLAQLATVQERLLTSMWPLLRPGGVLLYCTCSVFRIEGEQRVSAFVAHNTEAFLLPGPGHLLPTRAGKAAAVPENLPSDHDGYFYARIRKQSMAHAPQ
ncbi:16S rRNA (cytosine(967)-C(5))-methyltransferase RsmB [Ramlibacter sp. AW1]|uniref:16S rRNA (cytosine(967)-C(5))-methyltransferase n=1 Tax=Ramlibacter aurantiacus TaxID=2801330 RepID=A0A936ZMR4_9BURK|nr:16S rRNA (cytosine(967)-C(5))-methyltransferase RsmB [Ramlibacter aurantiacus]